MPIPPAALAGNPKANRYVRLINEACEAFAPEGEQALTPVYALLQATDDPVEMADLFHALVTSDAYASLTEADQIALAGHFITADSSSSGEDGLVVSINDDFVIACLQPRPALGKASVIGDLIMRHDPEGYGDIRSTVALLTLAVMHAAAYEPEDDEADGEQATPAFPCDIKIGTPNNASRAALGANMHDILVHAASMVREPNSLAQALFDDPTSEDFKEMLERAEDLEVDVVGRGQYAKFNIRAPVARAQLPAVILARRAPSPQERRIRGELEKLRGVIVGNDTLHEHMLNLSISLWDERLQLKHGMLADTATVESQQPRHIFLVAPPGAGKSTSAHRCVVALETMGLASREKRLFLAAHDIAQKYTGWTGQFVAEKFRETAGGTVIFDGFDAISQINSFGPQAVNAVNDEITKPRRPNERPSAFFYTMYPRGVEDIFSINPGMRDRVTVINMALPDGALLRQILALELKARGLEIGRDDLESCGEAMDLVLRNRKSLSGYGRIAENVAGLIASSIRLRMFDEGTLSLLETTPKGRIAEDAVLRRRTVTAADLPLYDADSGTFKRRPPAANEPAPNAADARSGAASRVQARAAELGFRVVGDQGVE